MAIDASAQSLVVGRTTLGWTTLLPERKDSIPNFTIFYTMKSAPGLIQLVPKLKGVPMDREIAQRPHRVTAVFQDIQLSFDVLRGASLAQLVEQLSVLGEAHGGLPMSVDVRIAVASTP